MKVLIVFVVGCAFGAVGMTLVDQKTYQDAKRETRSHIDSAMGSAATATHNALSKQ